MPNAIEISVEERMLQQLKKRQGKLNRCPCGCTDADLDHNGMCIHFIGATREGQRKPTTMYPREQRYLKRFNEETRKYEDYCTEYFSINGKKPMPIPQGSFLVWIENTARVYHPQGLPLIDPRAKDNYPGESKVAELLEASEAQREGAALGVEVFEGGNRDDMLDYARQQNEEILQSVAGKRGKGK